MPDLLQSKAFKVLALIAVVMGVGVYIQSSSQPKVAEDQVKPASLEANDQPVDQSATIIELEMSNYKFSQDKIIVKAGQRVTLKLDNLEGFHDLVIDELGVVSDQIAAGAQTEVSFVVPENAVGQSYEFYCSVGNHRQLGMIGLLQIE